ncbi:pantoate--beta-alanine ligase [Desulfobaculum xiamenense]|uniref:Pantothenate synthetase n=1 Tax=Desulfobaculum xiamenense TaxID=995050 RepID=A0A846QM97_9BACT|nr:pantoate--beta-alanine ligase [Desulfobaculum xiamenense]NJB68150.1 pantoate--beta-alanine ligase [Desulfobaculum xiamenense]
MQIITDPREFQNIAMAERAAGRTTALVPTMGYLHDGHKSLITHARANADRVYVSVFVNPTQFGPNEDLAAYPRDLDHDAKLAEAAGADILFAPKPEDIYPEDHATWVEVPSLAKHLCAKSRPIHFRGVATVVSILLHLALPTFAVFGQKDWQQLALLRRMARDMHMPTEIVGCPIVREADGLALSSRNVYMTPEQRACAPHLRKGILHIADLAAKGERNAAALREALTAYYAKHIPMGVIDYIEFVHPENIVPVTRLDEPTLVAIAVSIGKSRLLDNMLIPALA